MRVAIADDSALFRRGLALVLSAAEVEVTAEAPSGEALLVAIRATRPDVVILDIRMPPTFTDEGLRAADDIRAAFPGVGVLVLSTYAETPYAVRLLQGGSRGVGYLLKDRVDDPDMLLDALQRIAAGESVIDPEIVSGLVSRPQRTATNDLTERERDVLRLMAEGRSNAGIAQHLFLSEKSVERYVNVVFSKLGLPPARDDNRRVLAVLAWLRSGTQDA